MAKLKGKCIQRGRVIGRVKEKEREIEGTGLAHSAENSGLI